MEKVLLTSFIICLFLIEPFCHGQTPTQVSDPRLELVDDIIHIYYDFLNSTPSDRFTVNIDIKNANGDPIIANDIYGDIGEDVSGGSNKQVSWNLASDNLFLNERIFVKIKATIHPAAQNPIAQNATVEKHSSQTVPGNDIISEETSQEDIKEIGEAPTGTDVKSYDRAGIILQSFILPGLGLSRITGSPHWLRGLAGYGCLTGAVILDRQAKSTYSDFTDNSGSSSADDLYNDYLKQKNTSLALAYTTAGIWIADFVWNILGTSDLSKKPLSSESGAFSIRSSIDPLTYTPLVNLTFKF